MDLMQLHDQLKGPQTIVPSCWIFWFGLRLVDSLHLQHGRELRDQGSFFVSNVLISKIIQIEEHNFFVDLD